MLETEPKTAMATATMVKVIVFGTFDILHKGHIDFFRQAKEFGDILVAVVARDSTVEKIKGHKPENEEDARLAEVRKETDEAMLGYEDDHYRIIEEQKPDVICLGYDQDSFSEGLAEEIKKRGISAKIVRLKPYMPEEYKSSKLRG
jgi:FAD synthetase